MRLRPLAPYLALAAAGTGAAALFAPHFENANVLRPFDYMQYWSAGRAVLDGRNPYDGAVLYPYQQHIGTNWEQPVMMWNPPWTLPAAMALGSLHWRVGQLGWLAANLAAVLAAAALLWRVYRSSATTAPQWLPFAVALGFGPTVFLLLLGQISGFLLLGVAGFLACVRAQRFGLAGVCLALTAIKPHLLAPFALVLALEAIRVKPLRRTILVGVAVLAACGVLPLLWDANIWSEYRAGTSAGTSGSNNTISEWIHPTIGFLLREALPDQPRWAMFVPLALVLPLVGLYWWKRTASPKQTPPHPLPALRGATSPSGGEVKNVAPAEHGRPPATLLTSPPEGEVAPDVSGAGGGDSWNWSVELPRLVVASLLAAPYGAWAFDLVLLLVPVLQMAAWFTDADGVLPRLRNTALLCYASFNVVLLLTLLRQDSMTNYWIAPVVAVAYGLASFGREAQPRERGESRSTRARATPEGVS